MTPPQSVDILILSNGPGEVATWVRPVVKALRQQLGNDREQVRISVVLSPCVNASGKEAEIALSYPEVDRVQGAKHFFPFLLWGKTAENWEWRDRGVVIFLGGDQFFTVVIGKRLSYRTVIYAEWEARWHGWIDKFAVMKPEIISHIYQKYANKFTVVGDLMAEVATDLATDSKDKESVASILNLTSLSTITQSAKSLTKSAANTSPPQTELIGLLPGSKPGKLAMGVPFMLAIAELIHAARPQTRFVIPVAPTLDLQTLASFADAKQNSVVQMVNGTTAELVLPKAEISPDRHPYLQTAKGLEIELWTRSPAYDLLSQCHLCLTTVGANTAELGSLAVPMIVLLPTYQLDAMRAWDGLPGLLANLPVVGSIFAKVINWIALRKVGLLAWPNIWAKAEIVPELVGKIQPQTVAELAVNLLAHPEKLAQMRDRLHSVRGQTGAAQKLAQIVQTEISDPPCLPAK